MVFFLNCCLTRVTLLKFTQMLLPPHKATLCTSELTKCFNFQTISQSNCSILFIYFKSDGCLPSRHARACCIPFLPTIMFPLGWDSIGIDWVLLSSSLSLALMLFFPQILQDVHSRPAALTFPRWPNQVSADQSVLVCTQII